MRRDQVVTRSAIGDSASDVVLFGLLAIVAAVGGIAWLTGQLAGLLFMGRWPAVSFPAAVQAALRVSGHLHDPRDAWPAPARADLPGWPGFAVALVLSVAVASVAVTLAMSWWLRRRPRRGFAAGVHLRNSLSASAVIRRVPVVRPSLAGAKKLRVQDGGVLIGRAVQSGLPVACSAEDSVLLLAAPRTGKTSAVVIPWLHSWPGTALVTSIRSDILLATAMPRRARGPVAVMVPTGMISWPDKLTWDLTCGCESFDKARVRADVMVTVGKSAESSDSTDGGYFAMSATNLLAGWLHAAALSGGSAADVVRWAFNERLDEPIRILGSAADAADGTAAMLDALYRLPADTTRASLWTTAQTAVAPLLAPAARDTFIPAGRATDLEAFIQSGGTCYLMADERRATALAPVMSAFADDFIETAKGIADAMPGGRLDPPLLLALDEVANIVPLPQLPALMSFAGGTGLFVTAVLQSMAQARNRWGRDAADMLWGASTVKVVLGGLAGEDLEEVSRLCGEYRETVISWQRGGQGGPSMSSSLQDRKTLNAGQVRVLDPARREALVIHSTTPAVKVRLTRHYEGPDREVFAASVKEARQIAGLDAPRIPRQRKPEAPEGEAEAR